MKDSIQFTSNHAMVNGIPLYFEIYGKGEPLVLLHGGGSTIQSSFERVIPLLSTDHKLIAIELQNHGRSGFREEAETFEQDAEDVVALLKQIGINKTSILGFSNGGNTALLIASRYPGMVNKLVIAGTAYQREGFPPGFFEGMKTATLSSMPPELQKAFLDVTPDSAKLQMMFEKDRDRMNAFKDFSDTLLTSIRSPTLFMIGDKDVVTPEHAIKMQKLVTGSRLAIIPGGHGKYIGEITTVGDGNHDYFSAVLIIQEFLNQN